MIAVSIQNRCEALNDKENLDSGETKKVSFKILKEATLSIEGKEKIKTHVYNLQKVNFY